MDYRLPGSSIHGILQTRILETVAISFSRGSSWPRNRTCVSYVTCIGSCVTWKPLVLPGKPHSNITSVLTNGGNLDRKTDMDRETDMPRGKLMWRHMGRRQPMTGVMHLSITHNAEHRRSLTSKYWLNPQSYTNGQVNEIISFVPVNTHMTFYSKCFNNIKLW